MRNVVESCVRNVVPQIPARRRYLIANRLPLYEVTKKLRSDNQINSRIRSVCYWLKCCIGARFSKTRSTERNGPGKGGA